MSYFLAAFERSTSCERDTGSARSFFIAPQVCETELNRPVIVCGPVIILFEVASIPPPPPHTHTPPFALLPLFPLLRYSFPQIT